MSEMKVTMLAISKEHFLRLGFSKVTMREIATDLGMSKKTLYEYFQSKEELLSEVINRLQNEVREKIDATIENVEIDFLEKIEKTMLKYGAKVHHYPERENGLRVDISGEKWAKIFLELGNKFEIGRAHV